MSRPPLGRGAVARSWPIFATEAPEHVVELRGALLQTESDALNSGEAGAGARRETVVKRAPAASFRGGGESTTAPAQRVALVATKTRSAEASAAAFVAVRCRESPHRTSERRHWPCSPLRPADCAVAAAEHKSISGIAGKVVLLCEQ